MKSTYIKYLKEPVFYDGKSRQRFYGVDTFESFNDPVNSKLDDFNGDIYLISDHHFNHKRIISFSDRPFTTLELMEQFLIDQHNDIVKPNDIVIIVGDFAFCNKTKGTELLSRLNGYKILILGNHDVYHGKIKDFEYDEIHTCKEWVYNETDIFLSHYPIEGLEKTHLNIHGHVHKFGTYITYDHHFNVNCEFINYTPIHIRKILDSQ